MKQIATTSNISNKQRIVAHGTSTQDVGEIVDQLPRNSDLEATLDNIRGYFKMTKTKAKYTNNKSSHIHNQGC